MPLVSVISLYAADDPPSPASLPSVLSGQHRDLELIAIGGDRQTLPSELRNDDRLRCLPRHHDNDAAALNAAIANSQGDYIAWIQPGDEWQPEKLSRQLDALQNAPEAAIAWSPVAGDGFHPSQHPRLAENLADRLRLYPVWETRSNPLVRRAAIDAVGGFEEDLPLLCNWRLWVRLSAEFDSVAVPEPLVRRAFPSGGTPLSRENWEALQRELAAIGDRHRADDDFPDVQAKRRDNLKIILIAAAFASPDWLELRDPILPLLRRLLDESPSLQPHAKLVADTYRQLVLGARSNPQQAQAIARELSDRWLSLIQIEPQPLISVIIPAYNSEATIEASLRSVFAQTLTDFEVIVVDDASSDRTADAVESFSDPRLSLIRSPENRRPATSRNIGAKQARGRYFTFIDADDLWTSDKLQAQYDALEANPDTAVAYSWTDYIDAEGNWLRSGSYLNIQESAVLSLGLSADATMGVDALSHLLLGDVLENGSNALIRRDAFERVGGFDPEFVVAHDWDLFLRLADRYLFVCVPQSQIRYRLSGSSISSNVARQERYCRQALDRAYDRAPQALQGLRSQSFINLYHYLTYRTLQPPLSAEKGRLAIGFLDRLRQLDPRAGTRRVDSYRPLIDTLETICKIYVENPAEVAERLCQSANLSCNPEALFQYTKSRPYPAISVIVPAYNAEDTIRETLESVLAQSFSDFEIIVIDDGSSDRTVEVVKSIDDDRLRVYSYPNAGQGESRNRGAGHASGEFFAFLDSDDLWTTDKLEAQYRAIVEWDAPSGSNYVGDPERSPAVAYSWVDWIDESGRFIQRGCDYTCNGYVYPKLLLSDFIAGGSNLMMWRGAFYKLRGFNPDFPPAEDRDMWLRLAEAFHFIAVEKPQLLYRQVPTSQSANVERMERSQRRVIEAAYQRAPDVPPFVEYPERLDPYRRQTYANAYKYLTFKALDGEPTQSRGKLALRLLRTVLHYEPQLWQERRFLLKLWLRVLATAYLPPAQTRRILQRFATFPKLHAELLRYTKMGVES